MITGLVLCVAFAATSAEPPRPHEVLYVHQERIYLSGGSLDGVVPGSDVEVRRDGRTVGWMRVEKVTPHHSTAVVVRGKEPPVQGDRVVYHGASAPMGTGPVKLRPRAKPADPRRWLEATEGGFPKVMAQVSSPPPRRRAEAFLHSETWLYLDSLTLLPRAPGKAVHHRQRLTVRLDGPVDPKEQWYVSVDAELVGQMFQPPDTRFVRDAPVWMNVYEANLTYRGAQGLEMGTGRKFTPGLRYGLVDGFFATWRFGRPLTLRMVMGMRPDPLSLTPGVRRPVAAGMLDGALQWKWGSLAYSAALSWLGRDGVNTEGSELTGRAILELWRTVWLDAHAGGLAWLDKDGKPPRISLDQAGLTASVYHDEMAFRASVRRFGSAALPSEAIRLPERYMDTGAIYDANVSTDMFGTAAGFLDAGTGLTSGVTWDDSHRADRLYLAPQLNARLSPVWNLHGRLTYRCELGRTGAQLVDVGFGFEPLERLRLEAWHQGGVWILQDSQQVLPASSWALSAEMLLLPHVRAGLRSRSSVGMAGRGAEVHAYVGATDGW